MSDGSSSGGIDRINDIINSISLSLQLPEESSDTLKSKSPLDELIEAAAGGNVDTIDLLLNDPNPKYLNSVNDCDKFESYTPLIWAAKVGHVEVVKKLLSYKQVLVDKKGGWNETTALIRAIERGHTLVVRTLIKKADLNATTKYGMTALMLAAEIGDAHAVENINALMNAGANVNLANQDLYTGKV